MIDPLIIWQYLQARLHLDRRDAGVITTEMAVAVFLVIAGAIVVIGILMAAAEDNANNVPTP